MSYLAIARKYRPANFDEMVGQDHVTRILSSAIARGRVHHAFLFCGARGVGKTTAARALAKALNCAKGPTATPCGECTSCLEIAAGNSPDLIEIDGASNNSVDDVRELRETIQYAPTLGKYKIYLIDEVHMLSGAAFNALLKTLEEPPPSALFIFATTEASKIPDTILSRVQRFDFKRIPVAVVSQRLAEIAEKEGVTIGEAGLKMIARAGEGSMRDAQSLLDKIMSFSGKVVSDAEVAETLGLIDRDILFRMLDALIHGDASTCLDVIGHVYNYGYDMAEFTEEMLEMLRNATFVRLSDEARKHVDLAGDEIERLMAITSDVDVETLPRLFAALLETHDQVSRAARPRIVLEMAIARLASTRPVVPVAALFTRLEDLDRKLRSSGGGGGGGGGGGPRGDGHRAGPGRSQHHSAPTQPAQRARSPRTRSSALPSSANDDDRFAALKEDLLALDPPATALAEGMFRRSGAAIVVTVASGRPFAAAQRLAEREEVKEIVAQCYGPAATMSIEASLASRRADITPEMEELVRKDPGVQRLLRVLGARLEGAKPPEGEA